VGMWVSACVWGVCVCVRARVCGSGTVGQLYGEGVEDIDVAIDDGADQQQHPYSPSKVNTTHTP
jgi:hypothetical protein